MKNPYSTQVLEFAREEVKKSLFRYTTKLDTSSEQLDELVRDIEYLCRVIIVLDKKI